MKYFIQSYTRQWVTFDKILIMFSSLLYTVHFLYWCTNIYFPLYKLFPPAPPTPPTPFFFFLPTHILLLIFPADFSTELQYIRQDLPTFEDLSGAATALMRLQDTYRLDTSKIAHGDIRGVPSTTLSGIEWFNIMYVIISHSGNYRRWPLVKHPRVPWDSNLLFSVGLYF
jgi:hypothetical protein